MKYAFGLLPVLFLAATSSAQPMLGPNGTLRISNIVVSWTGTVYGNAQYMTNAAGEQLASTNATIKARQDTTNNSLWAWSTITTNTVLDRVTSVTNNTKIARTDFSNDFSVSNNFGGNNRILALFQDKTTNAHYGAVIRMGYEAYTNCSDAITLTGLSEVSDTLSRTAVLWMNSNGGERAITIPESWKNHEVATVFYITNGWIAKLTIETYGSFMTNVSWVLVR